MELRGLEPLAFWMQTMGAALLVVEQCSLVRVWMAAQDSRSAHALLYLAAVQDDRHHLIRSDLRPPSWPAPHSAGLLECWSTISSERHH